uniref:Uncharacterized protein n=1 Tax=Setaria viridis TaxID=4556 RepID=A0A4U6WD57_SETVI|nr:LOW QUALITY PROTEIN: hypothetical protein SEVIR_1G194800v2 [Setaria viridis]
MEMVDLSWRGPGCCEIGGEVKAVAPRRTTSALGPGLACQGRRDPPRIWPGRCAAVGEEGSPSSTEASVGRAAGIGHQRSLGGAAGAGDAGDGWRSGALGSGGGPSSSGGILIMAAAAELAASIWADVEVKDDDFPGMTEPERAAEAERRRQEVLEQAREMEQRAREEGVPSSVAKQMARRVLWHRGRARILDFDPKQEGAYCNRCYYVDHPTFDLDEECKMHAFFLNSVLTHWSRAFYY